MQTETQRLLTMGLIVGMVALLQVRAAYDSTRLEQTADHRSSRSGDEIPTLEIRISLRSSQPNELEPAYRFLWKHWMERRAARVTVTFYGIDAGVQHIVTIRRVAQGVWQIDEHRRYYAARQRKEQTAILVQSARKVEAIESAKTGFSLELVGSSGDVGRLFKVENWPKQ